MTFIVFLAAGEDGEGRVGNTTTAFGKQEWLRRATSGEIVTPTLERWGVVSAKEFEANLDDRGSVGHAIAGSERERASHP